MDMSKTEADMPPYGELGIEDAPQKLEISIDLDELSEEMVLRAKKELGETPEVRTQALIDLRSLINDKAEFSCRTDDDFLVRFLRARYFNVKLAYELLQNYLKFKEEHPEIHENVYPKQLRVLGEDGVISVPPYKDQDDRRIIYMKIGNWSPSKYNMTEIFKAGVVMTEIGVLERASTVTGAVCVFDLKGLGLSHVWHMSPSAAQILVDLLARCCPLRIHAVHVVNQPYIFNAMFALIKPLLSQKMTDKIHFHGEDLESLHQHISPKHLAKTYGGVHEEYNYSMWIDYLDRKQEIKDALRCLRYRFEEDEQ